MSARHINALLALLLVVAAVCAMSMGLEGIGFAQFLSWLGGTADPAQADIFLTLRLPRVLCAVIAGAGLALAGLAAQSALLNALVCPSVLGIASGAAFGASLAIMYGSGLSVIGLGVWTGGPAGVVAAAFCMAMLAVSVAYALAGVRRSRETVILAGIAVNYLFAGGIVLLQYLADWQDLRAIVFWTVGSLWNASLASCLIMGFVLLLGLAVLTLFAPRLNAMRLGEETALGLGVRVHSLRFFTLMTAALISATMVSFCGAIGFLGLMAPHMARRLLGGTDLRLLLPAVPLLGALLLLLADTAARTLLWPQEMPVGIMTSLVGGPFFLFLLLRGRDPGELE